MWEWQSESFILNQQSHYSSINCAAYSQDGLKFATGGEDSKVKVWHANSGFCFKTFTNHTAAVTGICFTGRDSSVIVTSSLDGTVRAFDLRRYRNFRTMMATGDKPGDHAQFSCVAADSSGEMIAAASRDSFEVYLFNLRTGKLLERFSGHQAPVSSVAFHPLKAELASCSWDGSLMIRNIYAKEKSKTTDAIDIDIGGDLLALAYRPDGEEIAVSSTKGELSFVKTGEIYEVNNQINISRDLSLGRQDYDRFSGKKRKDQGGFSSLAYTSNGRQIYCGGGQALNCCLYDIKAQILLAKYETTPSRSQSGNTEGVLKKRQEEVLDGDDQLAKLPGVRKGDVGMRSGNAVAGLVGIALSPTNDQLALISQNAIDIFKSSTFSTSMTEVSMSGFSDGSSTITEQISFMPTNLDSSTTPKIVESELLNKNYLSALKKAIALNNRILIKNVLESFVKNLGKIDKNNQAEINLLFTKLTANEAINLLDFTANELKTSRHLEFYLLLANTIAVHFGLNLKKNGTRPMALYTKLERSLLDRRNLLMRLFEENSSRVDYLLDVKNMGDNFSAENMDVNDFDVEDGEGEEADEEMENFEIENEALMA